MPTTNRDLCQHQKNTDHAYFRRFTVNFEQQQLSGKSGTNGCGYCTSYHYLKARLPEDLAYDRG